MRVQVICLTIFLTLVAGCDRQTLDGLRLRFEGQFQSDYKKSEPTQSQSSESSRSSLTHQRAEQNTELRQSASQDKSASDSEEALPFKPLESCSRGDIVAQTNQIFYQRHSELKSIDSKDEQLMQEWKEINAQVAQKCQE